MADATALVFLSCSLICAALPNLFSGSFRSLRIFFFNKNNNHFYYRKFPSPPPPSFAGVRTCGRCTCISLVDLNMKFTTSCLSSSHIIGVAIWSSKLLNRIIHNKINYGCTICVWERERERLLMGVFLKFCVGMNLPLVPEEGLLACTKLCLCFYLFTPLPPSNDNFIFQSNATKIYHLWKCCFQFYLPGKAEDQIISNKLAVVSVFYGYKA